MQDPTPSGKTTVNSQTLLDPKMVHRLHWLHVLDKPPFWAGHDLVFAQGINKDLLFEPLCSKYGELKKKNSFKMMYIIMLFKTIGKYTVHATC